MMTKKQQRNKKPLSGRMLGVVSAFDLAAIVVSTGLFLCLGDNPLQPLYVAAAAILGYFGWTLCVMALFSRTRRQNRVMLAVNLLGLLLLAAIVVFVVAVLYGLASFM